MNFCEMKNENVHFSFSSLLANQPVYSNHDPKNLAIRTQFEMNSVLSGFTLNLLTLIQSEILSSSV